MARAELNQVFLAGNLTRDPEARQLNSGDVVCNMRVAMNRRYRDRNGEQQEQTTYADVDVWGRQADACNRYLHRGSGVLIEGRLQTDEWEDRETGNPGRS